MCVALLKQIKPILKYENWGLWFGLALWLAAVCPCLKLPTLPNLALCIPQSLIMQSMA